MPLVKLFTKGLTKPLPLPALQSALCKVWGTKPSTTKLMAFEVQDWTHEGEDVFVDVRAKATPDRTREAVLEKMGEVQQVFLEHGLRANVRLQTISVVVGPSSASPTFEPSGCTDRHFQVVSLC